MAVDTVILHHISLPPERLQRRCGRAFLHQPARHRKLTLTSRNCASVRVSAHFLVRRHGEPAAVRELRRARLACRPVASARARSLQRFLDRYRTGRQQPAPVHREPVSSARHTASRRFPAAIPALHRGSQRRGAGPQGRPGTVFRLVCAATGAPSRRHRAAFLTAFPRRLWKSWGRCWRDAGFAAQSPAGDAMTGRENRNSVSARDPGKGRTPGARKQTFTLAITNGAHYN